MTTTEIILLIGLILIALFAFRLLGANSALKEHNKSIAGHNKTLYDLYCQNHLSATSLLETTNKSLAYQKELEEKIHRLSLELLQKSFRPE